MDAVAVQQRRLHNWYVQSHSLRKNENEKGFILCGDQLVSDTETTFKFHQFCLLKVVKVVTAGFQCLVLDHTGHEQTVSCRWDQQDRYFRSRHRGDTWLKHLTSFCITPRILELYSDLMDNSRLCSMFEDNEHRLPLVMFE